MPSTFRLLVFPNISPRPEGDALAPGSWGTLVAMRLVRGLLAVSFFLVPAAALAEADVFGLGNGQHGSLMAKDAGLVLNAATALTADAGQGGTELRVVDSAAFAAEELVLVLQVGSGTASGARAGVVELQGDSGAGRWELARLAGVEPGVLRLTAPLVRGYVGAVSQVVRVPEYTDVHVSTSASLQAPPWNGRSGGVLAFLATGTVFNMGALNADGLGFRGGEAEPVGSLSSGCQAEDGPSSSGGGARKGEGLSSASADAASHGHGQLANGGGGGNCRFAGGGGGGHAGQGGQGGRSAVEDGSRDVGGRGGAALLYAPLERLMLGGGGGAGEGGSAGGAGGGIIFVRARQVQGPRPRGFISANGLDAASASAGGAGGGGAGGTVHVRVAETLGCTSLEAVGGAGGYGPIAPGGGGGGGQVLLQAQGGPPADCAVLVSSGLAGTSSSGSRGAAPASSEEAPFAGRLGVLDQGFAVPPVPTWVSPSGGEARLPPQPRLEGRTAPGATVWVLIDGQPVASSVQALDSGGFVVVPSEALALGPHQVQAWAEHLGVRSALSAPLSFIVGPPGTVDMEVGFGCSSGGRGGTGWGAVVLLLVLGWFGQRRSPSPWPSPEGRGDFTRARSRSPRVLPAPGGG